VPVTFSHVEPDTRIYWLYRVRHGVISLQYGGGGGGLRALTHPPALFVYALNKFPKKPDHPFRYRDLTPGAFAGNRFKKSERVPDRNNIRGQKNVDKKC
jgi:hypothetical protein